MQEAITTILLEETAILTVKDVVLQYDDHAVEAKLLALFLEVPYVNRKPRGQDRKKKVEFKRTQSNILPGARKGMPTSQWFETAIRQGLREVEPLGQELTKAAIKKCVKDLLS